MANIKGYTIVELMVALFLMAFLLVTVLMLVRWQSRYGTDAWVKRSGRQASSIAMGVIMSDVMHAGYGLSKRRELAVYPVCESSKCPSDHSNCCDPNPTPDWYNVLYANYGKYLSVGNYEVVPSVFDKEPYVNSSAFSGNSVYLGDNIKFTTDFDKQSIGAFISYNTTTAQLSSIDLQNVQCFNETLSGVTKAKCTWSSATASPTAGFLYAPAVKYERVGTKLMRNGTAIMGDQFLLVRDFRVRFLFRDTSGVTPPPPAHPYNYYKIVPVDGLFGQGIFGGDGLQNLRLLEVTIRYEVRDPSTTTVYSGTMTERVQLATPRTLAMTAP